MAILLWFEKTKQEPTQVIIANWSKLVKMTVSKSLKALALHGFVKRSEHKIDTRAKSVHLTTAGRELASKLVPSVEGMDEKFFSVIEEAEQTKLIHILNKIISNY